MYLRRTTIWELQCRKDLSALMRRLMAVRDFVVAKEGTVQLAICRMDAWKEENLGATAYGYFRPSQERVIWAKMVWAAYIPPKYSFTLWLAMRGRLLTKDRLEYLQIDMSCAFCGAPVETVQHLYFGCSFSKEIWRHIREWCGIRRQLNTLKAVVRWMKMKNRGTTWCSKRTRLAFICTIYYIWITRNRLLFDNLSPSIPDIVCRIKTHVYRVGYALYPNVSILH